MASRRNPPIPPRVFAPTVSHPIMDDFTLRALRHQAKQVPGTPAVFELPLRQHPMWSGNNSLGVEVPIADVSETAVFERTVLKLDEWGMPDVWTVSLSTNFVSKFGVNDDEAFFLIGSFEIGCGGAVDQFEVDWRNGTTFRLPMNALSVKVRGLVGDPAGGAGSAIPTDLAVRVLVSKSNQSGLPPQATSFGQLSTNGAVDPSTPASAIPKYAKSFRPLGLTHAAADAMFAAGNYWDFYATKGSGGTLIGSIRALDAVNYLGGVGGIPIPNPARFVVFNNNAAPADVRFDYVFDLCL
jgi:hypothetical protein